MLYFYSGGLMHCRQADAVEPKSRVQHLHLRSIYGVIMVLTALRPCIRTVICTVSQSPWSVIQIQTRWGMIMYGTVTMLYYRMYSLGQPYKYVRAYRIKRHAVTIKKTYTDTHKQHTYTNTHIHIHTHTYTNIHTRVRTPS